MSPSKPNPAGVYEIRNLKNGRVYVGSSAKIRTRFNGHRSCLRNGIHRNKPLQADWGLFGEESFRFSILEQCDASSLMETEAKYFSLLRSTNQEFGYNVTSNPKNSLGYKHSPESIEKTASRKRGTKQSEATKEKRRQAMLGRTFSPESIQRMRDAQSGRKQSQKTIDNWLLKMRPYWARKREENERKAAIRTEQHGNLEPSV